MPGLKDGAYQHITLKMEAKRSSVTMLTTHKITQTTIIDIIIITIKTSELRHFVEL